MYAFKDRSLKYMCFSDLCTRSEIFDSIVNFNKFSNSHMWVLVSKYF